MPESVSLKKKDMIWAGSANIMALISAVVIGLLMPALTDFETYAGYREYTLFTAYTALLQLGFSSGISLRYGGLDRKDLPIGLFGRYTRFLTGTQFLTVIIISLVYFVIMGWNVAPFLFVIITVFFDNMRLYYATILVNTGRFKIDSLCQIVYRIMLLAGFALIFVIKRTGWIYYLSYTLILNLLSWLSYVFADPEITFGKSGDVTKLFPEVRENIKRGVPVLFGEQLGILMLGADSIFALFLFDGMQFSFYSFAVYVVVTVYTVLNAANNVIFPYLKRLSKTDVGKKYLFLKKLSFLLFVFSLPCFVLCHILIERLMNAYAGALPYMDILIFTLLFRLLGGVACANTMKAMDMEREYFICNLTACIMAFAADVAAYLLFHDLKAIATASVAVYALWYVMCDMRIKRRLNEDTKRKI